MILPRRMRQAANAPSHLGPANGDFVSYVERLSRTPPAAPAPPGGGLDAGDWGRDAFELDELSAQAGKEAVSAEKIVAQSPYVSSELSLPEGVRNEVRRVREHAERALRVSGARAPAPPARAGATRRAAASRIWSFIRWGFFLLVVLPWLIGLLLARL